MGHRPSAPVRVVQGGFDCPGYTRTCRAADLLSAYRGTRGGRVRAAKRAHDSADEVGAWGQRLVKEDCFLQ